MPTTIPTTTSSTRPGSPSTGDAYFETDTNNYIIYDGANWRGYESDGAFGTFTFTSNSYSGNFDGTADYISVGTISQLNASSDFSLACYFRLDSTASVQHLFGAGSGNDDRVWGQVRNSTTIRIGVGSANDDFTVSTLSTGTWYHIVFSISGTSCTLYLNKNSQGSATVNSLTSTTFNNFMIGSLPTTAGFAGGFYYDGNLDEVALFDSALTSTQVADIYDSKLYVSPTAMYRLENDVTDETGNYDGTNNGVTFSTTDKPY